MNCVLSTSMRVACGVPQGSVLGPLFSYFMSMTYSMQLQIFKSNYMQMIPLYIYTAGALPEEAGRKLQPSLDAFSYWCRVNKLNIFMHKRLTREELVDKRDIRTRQHDAPMFLVNVPNLEAYKRSVEYAGAIKWNELPPEVRNIESQPLFKVKQKDTLMRTINQ